MTRLRLERRPVVLPPLGGTLGFVWTTLIELARRVERVPWVLVGGQMVLLHGLERDVPAPRLSTDIDAGIDVRIDTRAVRMMVAALEALEFISVGTSPEGIAHRFCKVAPNQIAEVGKRSATAGTGEEVVVDLLVPEGLAPTTDVTTRGGRAFSAPGLTQALHRSELVPVSHGTLVGWVPRPSLLGAIVAKAAAGTTDHIHRDRHLIDLAFLCGLVEDPIALANQTERGDRKRLRAVARLLPEDHPAWIAGAGDPSNARLALAILAEAQQPNVGNLHLHGA